MKVKGLNKIVADSKLLKGNAYLQICLDKTKKEVFAIWHTGHYVNFQKYFKDKNIITIYNTFKKVTRKQIQEMIEHCLFANIMFFD